VRIVPQDVPRRPPQIWAGPTYNNTHRGAQWALSHQPFSRVLWKININCIIQLSLFIVTAQYAVSVVNCKRLFD